MDIFTEIGILIIVASILAFLFKLMRQPIIPAYVLAGIIITPLAGLFGVPLSVKALQTMAEIGIAFLLFIVGMELELNKLKSVGLVASLGGICVSFLMVITIFFVSQIWLAPQSAFFLGLIFAFSSTMVVVKLLSDKRELGTLHGRIVVGRLLMEDFLAIIVLAFLVPIEGSAVVFLISVFFKILLIFFGSFLFAKYILPYVFKKAASDQKVLFLLALGLCFLFSIVMAELKLSIAIGGFIAGVILANTPYNLEIISHTKPVRDFFATLFFVVLGMQISLSVLGDIFVPIIILLFVFLIVKPLLGYTVCRFFGYTKSTSFLSAISLTQISEFGLIIATLLFTQGRITEEIFAITVAIAVITISLTSYLIKYDYKLYRFFYPILTRIDPFRKREKEMHYMPEEEKYDTLLIGYNRLGYHIFKKLQKLGKNILIVDFNPEVIHHLMKKKVPCLYGDIGDIEILQRINLKRMELIISTSPDFYDNRLLIKQVNKVNKHAVMIVTSQSVESALDLYEAGADYVIVPHMLGGEYLSILLDDFDADLRNLIDKKLEHIEELRNTRHVHPDRHFKRPLPENI